MAEVDEGGNELIERGLHQLTERSQGNVQAHGPTVYQPEIAPKIALATKKQSPGKMIQSTQRYIRKFL